ncbi:MAG: Zn-ribbon domain-containing OB-fold protein [Nitrospinota bacterium]
MAEEEMGLRERVAHIDESKAWYGGFPTYYIYTMGVAGERFFREIKDRGRLLGTKCPKCDYTYLPPRLYCERCFEKLEEWVEVSGEGTVHTYTVAHVDLEGRRLEELEVLAFVRLDGTDGGMVHRLKGVKPEEVSIGLRVKVAFKDRPSRTGSIGDIEGFRPL